MAEDSGEKTELPTGKRLTEAMERGQFARTPEFSTLFTMGATLCVIAMAGGEGCERIGAYAVNIFTHYGTTTLTAEAAVGAFENLMVAVAPFTLIVLGSCAGAALLAGGIQSGFNLTPKALGPHWDRLDPLQGLGSIISKDKLIHAAIDLLKILAIGSTLWAGARQLLKDPMFSSPVEAAYLITFLHQAAITFFGRLLGALSVVAALSYAYEKYQTLQELKMTRDEVKDETKNSDGDPMVKMAQRKMARRLAMKQMLKAVPTADVVVTNPTHYAVALKYERGRDQAPVVLAKGENRFALRIKAIAAEHGVPTVENRPVARMLFALGRVGETIPPELYQAVAEILAVVYRTHRYYFFRLRARRLEAATAASI
ncbi:MAG TPA: EscU/YscU/HrcU family type III secretion system export apparatus switch protein [Opitutaceae bacterium]|jgi:flagellar biosynthetic protein FlhB